MKRIIIPIFVWLILITIMHYLNALNTLNLGIGLAICILLEGILIEKENSKHD